MSERMRFDLGYGPRDAARRQDAPMRLLLIGDFSRHPAAQRPPLAERPTLRVDIDNLDAVIARLAPGLSLDAGDILLRTLDDLHPDALFESLPLFQALREAKSSPPESAAGLMDALLGGTPGEGAATPAAPARGGGLDDLIRRIVAPHVVPDTRAQDQAYAGAVDAAIADRMRALLHNPAFQALEAAWRGVHWLVSSLELDEHLQLHLFDLSREELLADIAGCNGRIADSGIHRALVDRWRNQPDGEGWSALVGLYEFGASTLDVGLLAALGIVAAQAGGPLIAGGDPALATASGPALEGWAQLRHSEVASHIGLVAPRILLRRPYGARSEPVAGFAFEELGNRPAHGDYLWACGALAAAQLIGRNFSLNGWASSDDIERDVEDLPSCTRLDADGEPELVPCAEIFLSDAQAEAMLESGLMPLLSSRHRNLARLLRMQTIADTPTALAMLPGG